MLSTCVLILSAMAAPILVSARPLQHGRRAALNFGTCTDPSIIFGAGLDGRKATEFSFLPNNLKEFNHGSALNPVIIMQSNCDTLVNKCGLTNADSTVIACRAAQTAATPLGKTGATADSFNKALGFTTNFAALDADGAGAAAGGAAAATTTAAAAAATNTAAGNADACVASTVTVTVTATATGAAAAAATTTAAATGGAAVVSAPPASGAALNFGKCTDPSIVFGAGLDGRKATEFSFLPNNLGQFSHGSALNPVIIMQSNCDTLVNRCGLTNADASVIACRAAQTAATSLGKTGAAADSFNGALGFKTNFATLDTGAAASAA